MSNVTVTAPAGVKVRVRLQQQETQEHVIPAVRNSGGDLLAPERKENYKSFVDKRIESFATEARTYEVGATQRLIVEEHKD